jgi:hypothetical protein
MKVHEFTIVASGLDPNADEFEDRFFEAGCGDATISFQKGAVVLDFARRAPNFVKALVSALRDVERAGAKVERIEPDHLVSISDIARRSGLTRAAISHYSKGMRASAFPAPVARVTSDSPLWDWYEVSRWMRRERHVSADAVLEARVVKDANLMLGQSIPRDRLAKRLERHIAKNAVVA